MSSRPEGVPDKATGQPQKGGYTIWISGAERSPIRDAYHVFLRLRWSASIALIAAGYFAVNLVFAIVYFVVGGVEGLHRDSFFDALVFSVQTLGTIGYGVMHPESHAANIVMIVESIVGIIVTALITGLIFSKFSRATGRFAFSNNAVICKHDGVPTLMFRCGNERSNMIVEAKLHVSASLVRPTAEGVAFYRIYDLVLVRDRMAGLRRGWTVMHVIDAHSPLYGLDAESCAKAELEIDISLTGLDDVTMQTVHGIHNYSDTQVRFGYTFVDTLKTLPNGDLLFDLAKFDQIEPESDSVPP